jgi:hypothetical protein
VKLKGRAKKITFHVFDPRVVEDLLDRDVVVEWREQDAITTAENRRRAAWKRRLSRSRTNDRADATETDSPGLKGWEDFERYGPLR